MSAWAVEALVASTLLMLVVLALRAPVAKMFGARASYMLWALPLLRLALPPLPTETPAVTLIPATSAPVAQFVTANFADMAGVPSAAGIDMPWVEIAIAVWATGAVLFLLVQCIAYARFRRMLLSDAEPMGRDGRVAILESAHATGPLAFGVLRPYVALPVDFADHYRGEERDMAIAHELMHHRRGDLLANMIALFMLGLHWCNPFAWIAYRAFRADQEMACDAQVLAANSGMSAQAYGRAILKAASGRHFAAACHLNTIRNLKGRLVMLQSHSQSLHRISMGMMLVAIVTAVGLALTASGSRAAQQIAGVSDQVAGANMTRLAAFLPEPVIAPAAPRAPEAPIQAEVPTVPETPEAPAVVTTDRRDPAWADIPPPVPAAPMAPSGVQPPAPPAAPAPPRWTGRFSYTTPDGRKVTQAIPSEADIRAMAPDVTVDHSCAAGNAGRTVESVAANGRRSLRISVCDRAIARQAQEQARQARLAAVDARRIEAEAERQARQARLSEADARRIEVQARAQAARGLRQARADIARDRSMSAEVRADVLADLDAEIAKLDAGND